MVDTFATAGCAIGEHPGDDRGVAAGVDPTGQRLLSVGVVIRVSYTSGPPESWRLQLDPGVADGSVCVCERGPGDERASLAVVPRQAPPADSLLVRCLDALALHFFGSLEMRPRIVGAPLWVEVDAELSSADRWYRRLQLDRSSGLTDGCTLRVHSAQGEPPDILRAAIEPADADPLRALLRLARGITEAAQPAVAIAAPSRRRIAAVSGLGRVVDESALPRRAPRGARHQPPAQEEATPSVVDADAGAELRSQEHA